MKAKFFLMLLRLVGWKLSVPEHIRQIKKGVLTVVPHTSNYDFLLGMIGLRAAGMEAKFLIKSNHMDAFYGGILKFIGGVAVDRSKANNLVDDASDYLRKSERSFLIITPEGTRKRVSKWRKGFYYIAKDSDTPLVLSYVDYKHKVVGIGKSIALDEHSNIDAVIKEMCEFYKDVNAKHPHLSTLPQLEP